MAGLLDDDNDRVSEENTPYEDDTISRHGLIDDDPRDFGLGDEVSPSFEEQIEKARIAEGKISDVVSDVSIDLQEHDVTPPPSKTPMKKVISLKNKAIAFAAGIAVIGGVTYFSNSYEVTDTVSKGNPPVSSIHEEIQADPSSGDGASNDNSNSGGNNSEVEVPKGGSKIKYSVSAEGGISQTAISWIDGDGNQAQDAGASVPWSKTVGMDKGKTSAVAINTSGNGSIKCSIYKNGKLVARDSASGDSPTIQCTGK